MTDLKTVNRTENDIEGVLSDNPVDSVALRSVLTPAQVTEVEKKKEQPQAVMTQLHGKSAGFRTLDSKVHPDTRAALDQDNKLMTLAPVVGG